MNTAVTVLMLSLVLATASALATEWDFVGTSLRQASAIHEGRRLVCVGFTDMRIQCDTVPAITVDAPDGDALAGFRGGLS
jgi:hypothetical protein